MRQSLLSVAVLSIAVSSSLLALGGCRSLPAPEGMDAPPAATAATTVVADDNLNAVLWVQRSAEYDAAAETVYRAATDKLDAALKDPQWDALVPEERATPAAGG